MEITLCGAVSVHDDSLSREMASVNHTANPLLSAKPFVYSSMEIFQ